MTSSSTTNSTKRKEPSASSNNEKVQLLLHTADGTVPYLTPHLLQKCFPVEQVQDHLLLGIAVRDSCVGTIFNKRKHPCGFTFTDTTVDPWLLPYPRITCPTFDLEQDAAFHSKPKVADDTTLASSKAHVMVWTGNGRLPLSNETYINAVQGLNSQAHVGLFDVCTIRAKDKRRLQATERTGKWNQELWKQKQTGSTTTAATSTTSTTTTTTTWASCLLVQARREFPVEREQFRSIQKAMKDQTVQGVAFVGPSCTDTACLEKAMQKLNCKNNTTITTAVLSVRSISHFLQCYQVGIQVLGVNLPAQWSKEGKAFAVDFSHYDGSKRPKVEEVEDDSEIGLDSNGCYTIGNQWIRDVRPILPGCSCMACQEHCRAYLYHLVLTKELLVGVLLFIHNLHHMLEMCRALTQARHEGKQKEIVDYIEKQLKIQSE